MPDGDEDLTFAKLRVGVGAVVGLERRLSRLR